MKLATTAQMRQLDRRTMDELGIPGEALMERAGEGVVRAVRRLTELSGGCHPAIHLAAGKGNNGGDAFAAARLLKELGYSVTVWLAGATVDVKGDALTHLNRMKAAGIELRELPSVKDWDRVCTGRPCGEIVVDGLLGTGTDGPAQGAAAAAIRCVNAWSHDALVVSIDIPSGLNADTGQAEGEAVRADVTVTMGLPKRGFVEPSALEYVGSLEVVDIGIPQEFVDHLLMEGEKELIALADLRPLMPRRARLSHKGTFGHVLLIGGSRGYSGSIALSARAALRSGAGLVTVLVPASIAPIVAGFMPEVMVTGVAETAQGTLGYELWNTWQERLDEFDAVLLGPGLTRHDQSLQLVRSIIRDCPRPLVLDADAISILEGQAHWMGKARNPLAITPHPGELARLMSTTVEKIQADRCGAVRAAVKATGATVVLKGAGTVIGQADQPLQVNINGNPGMATGGTGDVLAGMLTGLLGQGFDAFDAACTSVYLHGRAGDRAALRKSQAGLIAGDLIEEIPSAFRELEGR
ncbi:MAG: hypothetical protein A2X46_04425 [Lentisphaerae bacterium GWF2_57_35]|nr:MAG: hypothetical protein A2X46_04425 [Lentisphaerae bacterium GWF2_57_35]